MTKDYMKKVGTVYEIRVGSKLDPSWSDWFEGFSMICLEEETQLVGSVIDQAALFGLLAKIGRLNLPLLSLKRLED